jgi:hypothetical protein
MKTNGKFNLLCLETLDLPPTLLLAPIPPKGGLRNIAD